MSNARNAILTALLEGAIVELMVKTKVDNVYVDDTTTLAAKLAEIIASLNSKVTTESMNTAIATAIDGLIDGAPDTYNTLKEIAAYISEHEDVVAALNSAIGNKADKSTVQAIQTTVNALGALSKKSVVTEDDLDSALKEKVNAASDGNHSHSNKSVLDGITAAKVSAWDGKGKFYVQSSQPSGLTSNDLWVKLN